MAVPLMSALTSLLVRDGVVPVRKIEQALQRQVMSGGDLETVLLEMDAVAENVLSGYRAAVLEVAAATREEIMSVDGDVLALVPSDVAIEQRLVPLRVDGGDLHVAVHLPLTGDDLERLGFLLGYEIVSHVACEVRIAAALAHHYGAELPPRMVRLVGKMHGRPSGELPKVGRMTGRLSGHLADIPDKLLPDAADESAYRRPRYTRSGSILLEPAPPEHEETGPSTEPASSRRHTIPAPALGTDASETGPASEPPTIAALRKHHGPITLAAGERMLRQSTDRDQILAVFFAFARQFFDYTALFVVHDNRADGRESWGVGAPTEETRALSIPVDEGGAFAEVCRTLAPQVRRLDQTETDRDVCVGLRRPGAPPAMVMPVAIRQRPVLVLYGDRDGEEFDIGSAMELVRFGPRVVEAFEQLIIRKKRAGYAAGSDAEPERREEDREALKAAARGAARRTSEASPGLRMPSKPPPSQPRGSSTSWLPGKRRTNPGFMPDSSTSDDSWKAVRAAPEPVRIEPKKRVPKLSEPFAKEAKTDPDMAPVPVVEAKEIVPRRRRAPRRPPSQVLGIPRSAPPPPPAEGVDVGSPELDDDDDDLDLLYGDDDGYEIEYSMDADEDDGPEVVIDADDDDDEPQVVIDVDDDEDDEPEVQIEVGDEPEEEETASESEQHDTDPPPRPVSSYSVQGGPVDVVRTRSPSGRPKRRSEPARSPSEQPEPDISKRETPKERPSRRPVEPLPPPSDPPTGLDADSRSVIVDMGQQVHEMVAQLLGSTTAVDQQRRCEELTALGEAALPVLAQSFPGPLAWQREQRGRVPAASEISPIMRAMVTFGPRAASYVAALLSSAHPDVRFYAAVVASEIVAPELMDAVAERIHDEDKAVRRIAVQLLPRFAAFRGFAEIRTVIRRTARIRGKDLSRREHAIDAVAELRDAEMVPKLIELLREPDESLVKHVHKALVKIGCIDFGRSHKKWQAWWEKNRSRHRIEWLIDSLVTAAEPLRRQAGEELKRITQEYYGYHAGSPKRDRELIANKYRQWWSATGQRKFA